MPQSAQVSLAACLVASTIGTLIAVTPPNPSKRSDQQDSWFFLAKGYVLVALVTPFVLSAIHTSILAYFHPNIPAAILRHGHVNKLNNKLITWSAATSIPIGFILCIGVPIRLWSYASLGGSFTFDLAPPDRLIRTGVYQYLQHPSYTGTLTLAFANTFLLLRIDGAMSCWLHPLWYRIFRAIYYWVLAPWWFTTLIFGMRTRILQEESMMRSIFGAEWESWHTATSRLIPGIL